MSEIIWMILGGVMIMGVSYFMGYTTGLRIGLLESKRNCSRCSCNQF